MLTKRFIAIVSMLLLGLVSMSGCASGASPSADSAVSGASGVAEASSAAASALASSPATPAPLSTVSATQAKKWLLTSKDVPTGFELSDDTAQTFSLRSWRSYIEDSLEATTPKTCRAVANSGSLLSYSEMKKRPTAQDKVVTGATINDSPDVNYAVYQTLRIFPDAAHAQAFVAQRLIEAKRCQAIRVVTDDDETSGIKVSIAPITLSAPDTKAWSLTASQGVVRVNSLRTVGNVVIALDVLSNDPDVNAKASTLQPLWVAIDSRVAAS